MVWMAVPGGRYTGNGFFHHQQTRADQEIGLDQMGDLAAMDCHHHLDGRFSGWISYRELLSGHSKWNFHRGFSGTPHLHSLFLLLSRVGTIHYPALAHRPQSILPLTLLDGAFHDHRQEDAQYLRVAFLTPGGRGVCLHQLQNLHEQLSDESGCQWNGSERSYGTPRMHPVRYVC